jgi:hypothetical protein
MYGEAIRFSPLPLIGGPRMELLIALMGILGRRRTPSSDVGSIAPSVGAAHARTHGFKTGDDVRRRLDFPLSSPSEIRGAADTTNGDMKQSGTYRVRQRRRD